MHHINAKQRNCAIVVQDYVKRFGAPELESVQSMKHAIDRAEKDLMRQVARRREMENEMNSGEEETILGGGEYGQMGFI